MATEDVGVRQDALRCSDCGGEYRYDISIPSTLWNRVIRKNLPEQAGAELLCGACIIATFAKAHEPFTAYLAGEGVGGLMIHVEISGKVPSSSVDLVRGLRSTLESARRQLEDVKDQNRDLTLKLADVERKLQAERKFTTTLLNKRVGELSVALKREMETKDAR